MEVVGLSMGVCLVVKCLVVGVVEIFGGPWGYFLYLISGKADRNKLMKRSWGGRLG